MTIVMVRLGDDVVQRAIIKASLDADRPIGVGGGS
jgi:hypothetical protein